MPITYKLILIISVLLPSFLGFPIGPEWGFYGHRKINRMAVFTLPQEMIGFYKKNIEYITRESVAPDKRRYALAVEGVRHYIDLDYFDYEDSQFPRSLDKAIAFNSKIYFVNEKGDSTLLMRTNDFEIRDTGMIVNKNIAIQIDKYLEWNDSLLDRGQRAEYVIALELNNLPPWLHLKRKFGLGKIVIVDKFSECGIAPYYLKKLYWDLVYAFQNLDGNRILWATHNKEL